ncbi:hypothetical protein T492DRAFT_855139 [Pavlovales sp. CCMP2436]|nr:hypothetical protein T492DRAFT_855139 [Pavlovales sp. CCMP2436]
MVFQSQLSVEGLAFRFSNLRCSAQSFISATPPQPQPLSCGMTMAGARCKLENAGMPLAKAAELNDYELDDNADS